jgi:dihydrolipoamide dehydrogenase
MQRFDIVVIGGGPGGYVAAIRAAQLGFKTAVVDNWRGKNGSPALGGTCLNAGCIPSKALLDSSHLYETMQHEAQHHGIQTSSLSLDVATMIARKDRVVATLTGGIATLFLKHKIEWLKGTGRLLDDKTVEVMAGEGSDASTTLTGDHIIIATGSRPRALAAAPLDDHNVVDSSGALEFDRVPEHLVILGGGVIALELGSVWRRLGSQVTLLVRGSEFLPKADQQISRDALKEFSQQGLDIQLGTRLVSTKATKNGVQINYHKGEKEVRLRAEKLLVCVGREPNTQSLNASEIGLQLDEAGFIVVDDECRTNLKSVYAIGDVVRGPMLAHKASEEGVAVVERIAGQRPHVNYQAIPSVIYSHPEIAWAGYTSQELIAQNKPFRTGVFPFKANGRAFAMGCTAGFVKILSDAKTDRVLGVHIMGPQASEMIAEAVLAIEFDASAEDLARTVHAHPTLSEAFHEAALAVDKRTIHI